MYNIRLDFLTKEPVIYTNIRENKPSDFWSKNLIERLNCHIGVDYKEDCPFCEGNEHLTTKAIYENNSAKIIPNLYPIVRENIFYIDDNKKDALQNNENFCYISNGFHDVIVESKFHNKTYFNMSDEEFFNIYNIIQKRYIELFKRKDIKYISFFKNYKMLAGASLYHSHSQMISLNVVSPKLKNEIDLANKYYDEKGKCIFCEIIKKELEENKRVLCKNDKFVALLPYASFYKYEVRIYPLKHIEGFEDEKYIKELSYFIRKIFKMLFNTVKDFPFNLYLNSILKDYKKIGKTYHYNIRIIPKLTGSAGFEMASGIRINPTYPEQARDEIYKANNISF